MAFLEDRNLNPGVTVEADPFSLGVLIAWLEKQPRETEYNYTSTVDCLLGQYVSALGGSTDLDYTIGSRGLTSCPLELKDRHPLICWTVSQRPWTFGDALDRALSLQSQQSAK